MKDSTSSIFNSFLRVTIKQTIETALDFQFHFTNQLRLSQIPLATKNKARHLSKIHKQSLD